MVYDRTLATNKNIHHTTHRGFNQTIKSEYNDATKSNKLTGGLQSIMDIVICEDNNEDRKTLYQFVNRFFEEINCPVNIATFKTGDDFLNEPNRLSTKIVFLDIYMPGTGGIDIAKKIRETDNEMVIIFTTNSSDHGLDSYSVYALQYLVKPLNYAQVKEVMTRASALFADLLRSIEVISNRLTVKILIRDIMKIEVFDHACYIHTVNETIKSYCSLDVIEKQLEGSSFLRSHRSFLVNMRYIEDVVDNEFILKKGVSVPIRRNDKMGVKQKHRDYLFSLTRGSLA